MKPWAFWLRFLLIPLAVPLIPFAVFGELPGDMWVEHPDPLAVFVLGVAVLGGDVFLPIPSSFISVFLGARLGFGWGALAITVGMTVGVLVGYGLGRWFGSPLVRRHTSEGQRAVLETLESRYSYLALAGLRAVPVLAEASILSAGVAQLHLRRVLIVLTAANVSLALLYAAIGSAGQGAASPTMLLVGEVGLPVLAAVAAYLVYRALRPNQSAKM